MAIKITKKPLTPDEGKWEPMIFVAALAVATWLGYAFYGDRVFPQHQVTARAKPAPVAAEVSGPTKVQFLSGRSG